jgi:hypothetical protein
MPALALAMPAFAQDRDPRLSDSQEPGSVIVFPKFISGTVALPEGGTAPRTELEISVDCPPGVVCPEHQPIKIRFHWVCPGDQNFADKLICKETDFDVTATVWEKIVLVPDGSFAGVSNHTVPAAPCPSGYLIGWVIDTSDRPIKFDGLIGDAVIRQSGTAVSSYGAIPIQADPALANLALITTVDNGGLVFDGGPGHYLAATGTIRADVKYTNATTGPTFTTGILTLLTLDVRSNRSNNPVFVDLNFYAGNPSALGSENLLSTFTEFLCWTEQRIDASIDPNLTTTVMGRKGQLSSGRAEKFPFAGVADNIGPVTLLGLFEAIEGPTPGSNARAYFTPFSNDSVPIPTVFYPSFTF